MEGPTAALCKRSRSFLRFYPVITLDRLILEALHRKPYQTTQELAVRLGRSSKRVSGRLRWLEDRRAVRTGALVNGFFTWTLSEKMRLRLDIRSDSDANSESIRTGRRSRIGEEGSAGSSMRLSGERVD